MKVFQHLVIFPGSEDLFRVCMLKELTGKLRSSVSTGLLSVTGESLSSLTAVKQNGPRVLCLQKTKHHKLLMSAVTVGTVVEIVIKPTMRASASQRILTSM